MKDGGGRTRDSAAFYWRKGVAVMGHTILHTSTILFVLFLSQNVRVIYPKSKSLFLLSIIVIKFSFHLLQFTYFYLHPGVSVECACALPRRNEHFKPEFLSS